MVGTTRVVAALVASLLVAQPALAQTPANRREAQELTRQAIALAQSGDHTGAVDLYLKAYALVPLPALLSNIGTEYKASGKAVEALKYFCMYLEKEPTGNLASYVTAEAKTLYVELSGGQTVEDKDVCTPIPPPTPVEPPPVIVDPAPPPPPPAPAEDPGKALKWTGIGVGAAGFVSVGLGLYFGKEAARIDDLITNHPASEPWPSNINDLEDEGARDEKLQIAFLITGSALVIGGTVLYIVGSGKTRNAERAVALTPTASQSSVGLSLGGSF